MTIEIYHCEVHTLWSVLNAIDRSITWNEHNDRAVMISSVSDAKLAVAV